MRLDVSTFRAKYTDKDAAVKVLEEASEVHGAWQILVRMRKFYYEHESMDTDRLADELADCITACCNLAERYGIDLQDALDRVEQKNVERGRYD